MVHVLKNSDDWGKVLTKYDRVVIDCYSSGCAPCREIAPDFKDLASHKEFKSIRFCKYEVLDEEPLNTRYDLSVFPKFLFFSGGQMQPELTVIGKKLGALQMSLQTLKSLHQS